MPKYFEREDIKRSKSQQNQKVAAESAEEVKKKYIKTIEKSMKKNLFMESL